MPTSPASVGSTRVLLRDVARRTRLSLATVSMALSDHPDISAATKQHVRQVSRALGYRRRGRAARGEVAARLRRLGLLVVGASLSEPSYAALLQGLGVEAQRLEARLELAAVESSEPQVAIPAALRLAEQVDATLLIGYVGQALLEALVAAHRQCLVIGHVLNQPHELPVAQVARVAPDDLAMGRLATGVMLAAGHQRVGFICEVLPPGLSHWRWLMGYRMAHDDLGIPVDPQLIHVSGYATSGGAPAAAHYARLAHAPTAVVAPDAPIVASFLTASSALGKPYPRTAVVAGADPQRCASVGLSNVPMVYVDPQRLVRAASDWLGRESSETPEGVSVQLQPEYANLPAPQR